MSAPARPRHRHTGRRLLIGLVLLIGLLVAADRIAVVVAEGAVARTVQQSQHLQHRPGVSIGGFPFLTQLAAGKFDDIRLSDHDVTLDGRNGSLHVSSVVVTLRSVTVSRDFTSATAARTTATAGIDYADLSAALGVHVTYADAGRVRASASTTVAGVKVTGTVTARPVVRNGALAFVSPQVDVNGVDVPPAAAEALAGVFGDPIPLSGLPYGLTVRSLRATASGIVLSVSARNLTFHR